MDIQDIKNLALKIGNEWSSLAIELGYTNSQLGHLRTAFPFDLVQCIQHMIAKWFEVLHGAKISPEIHLCNALQNCGCQEQAEDIQSKFSVNGGATDIPENVYELIRSIEFRQEKSELKNYIDQSKQYLKAKSKEKDLFVNCKAFRNSVNAVENNGAVVIIGNPGDGKTTIAVNTLLHMQKEGAVILVFTDPSLIEKVYDDEKTIVYFVDDAFGTPRMNTRLVEAFVQLHDKLLSLIEMKKCKLVLTSRKHVYQQSMKLFNKCSLFKDNNVLDMSMPENHYTIIEKNRMICKHCQKKDEGLFPNYLQSARCQAYVPGFPLLCTMYARASHLTDTADEFTLNPLKIVREQVAILANTQPHSYCALVIIMMEDGELDEDIFDTLTFCDEEKQKKINTILKACGLQECELAKIELSLKEMVGVYVEENGGVYRFYHDSILDATCLEFGTKSPATILNVASSQFIQLRVRTEGVPGGGKQETDDVLIVKRSKYHLLAQRWISDAVGGHVSNIFRNPSIHDSSMLQSFIDRINKLKAEDFSTLINACDKHSSKSIIQKASRRGLTALLQALLNKISRLKSESSKFSYEIPCICLLDSVYYHHESNVKNLIQFGANIHAQKAKTLQQSIHLACQNGDVKITELLLQNGAHLESEDSLKKCPLHYACEKGHYTILKILIERGSSVNSQDCNLKTCLHYAAQAGSLDCVKLLVEKGAKIKTFDSYGKTVLHYASSCNSPEVLSFLIGKGLNVDIRDKFGYTPLHNASFESCPEHVKILLEKGADVNILDLSKGLPLHSACKKGFKKPDAAFECVKLLLAKDDVVKKINHQDHRGKTALYFACALPRDKSKEIVKILLEHGADCSICDHQKNMALFAVCENGNMECLKELIQSGIDVNAADRNGRQPIHFACGKGNASIIKLLINKGASLHCSDNKGKKPLHYASQYGNKECLEYLLKDCKVDPNVEDCMGQKPLHYACKWSKQEIVRLLMLYKADPAQSDNDDTLPAHVVPRWSSKANRINRFLRGSSLHIPDI